MGLAISLVVCAVAFIIVFVSRRLALVFLLLFVIMFAEQGEGFTSFAGSFVYDQTFVGLFKLKLIELIATAMLVASILAGYKGSGWVLRFEKRIYLYCLLVGCVLLFVEYVLHHTISIADLRTLIAGAVLVSVFCRMLEDDEDVHFCLKVFFFLMTTRALIGLGLYAVGHGVSTPRGMAPFFWDSRQVAAFGMCLLCLVSYLTAYSRLDIRNRLWGKGYAVAMILILGVTVLLSLRRSIWCIVLAGFGLVLVSAKRKSVVVYLLLGYMFILSLFLVASYDLNKTSRIASYMQSLNIFSEESQKNSENDVHVDNVLQYSRMISENNGVLLFGFRGYPGPRYVMLPELYSQRYPLGVPHNAVLRCIYSYGMFSLVGLFLFMGGALWCARRIRRDDAGGVIGAVAYGGVQFVLFDFAAALLFIPPFYTTNKGFFYTLVAVFLARYADKETLKRTVSKA